MQALQVNIIEDKVDCEQIEQLISHCFKLLN